MNHTSTRRSSSRLFAAVLLAAVVGGSLAGCIPLIFGGAVASGMVATDRRTSGAQLEDEGIELRASSRVRNEIGERVHVNITSYNRQVLLTGEVPSAQDKQLVEQIVTRVENVRAVVNELGVMGASSLSQRSSDSLVTGKVKASLLDSRDIFANSVKVVTERGTTYLLGRVTKREADRVTDITRGVSGVQRVVRVLEIISEEELQRLAVPQQTAPREATPPRAN